MTTLFIVLSNWLHSLATLIFIGYYIFFCLIFLSVLELQMQADGLRTLLKQVTARLQLSRFLGRRVSTVFPMWKRHAHDIF